MKKLSTVMIFAGLILVACDDLPADPEHTLERVQHEGHFQSAIVAGTDEADAELLVRRVEAAVGARAKLRRGNGELLLKQLEEGEIDLVVGEFAKRSPWSRSVTFSAPLGGHEPPQDQHAMRAAMRNGENGWIIAVEKAVRRK